MFFTPCSGSAIETPEYLAKPIIAWLNELLKIEKNLKIQFHKQNFIAIFAYILLLRYAYGTPTHQTTIIFKQ